MSVAWLLAVNLSYTSCLLCTQIFHSNHIQLISSEYFVVILFVSFRFVFWFCFVVVVVTFETKSLCVVPTVLELVI